MALKCSNTCSMCQKWIGFHGQHGSFAQVASDGSITGDERVCVCSDCIGEAYNYGWPEADGWRYFFAIV